METVGQEKVATVKDSGMLLEMSAGHCLGVNHGYGGGKRRII